MRWLTVDVPGAAQIVLERAAGDGQRRGPPARDPRDIVPRAAAAACIFSVDDCRASYEELARKGVEFTEEPTEHFYGIDCGLRDPFGNPLRMTQPAPGPIEVPSAGELANAE